MPQSMQRAAWSRSSGSGSSSSNSRQSCSLSATGRAPLFCRRISRKPRSLPMRDSALPFPGAARDVGARLLRRAGRAPRGLRHRRLLGEDALVLARQHLDDLLAHGGPAVEELVRLGAAGAHRVLLDEVAHLLGLVALEGLELDHLAVAAGDERAVLVEDEGEPARHAGGEVAAGSAEDDDGAAGHVLAAMVADALDDGGDAGVPHREALAGTAVEEGAPGDRAVEDGVADDDLVVGAEGRAARRLDDEDAAGEALAHIVVGVALELEGDAAHREGAEALPRRAAGADARGVVGEAVVALEARDLAGEHGADGAVAVADRRLEDDRLAAVERGRDGGDEPVVEDAAQVVVLLLDAAARAGLGLRVEHLGEIE